MRVALFSLNRSLNELFIEALFSRGITVFSSERLKEYLAIITNKSVDCLFIDIDIINVDWIKLIKWIKEKKSPKNIFIVIMTASIDNDFLSRLFLLGVNAIFDKKKSLKGYIAKIERIILLFESETVNSNIERRKYVRVKVRKEENIYVNIEMAGKEHLGYFKCRILDISIVAVAFHVNQDKLLSLFRHDAKSISNMQIIINKKVYFCEGELIRYKGEMAVARFKNCNNLFTLGIANYIYNKINK